MIQSRMNGRQGWYCLLLGAVARCKPAVTAMFVCTGVLHRSRDRDDYHDQTHKATNTRSSAKVGWRLVRDMMIVGVLGALRIVGPREKVKPWGGDAVGGCRAT